MAKKLTKNSKEEMNGSTEDLIIKGIELARLGKYEQSIECYDKAFKINPDDEHNLVNKGFSLYCLGKHEEAMKCYDKALKINPDYSVSWYNKNKEKS